MRSVDSFLGPTFQGKIWGLINLKLRAPKPWVTFRMWDIFSHVGHIIFLVAFPNDIPCKGPFGQPPYQRLLMRIACAVACSLLLMAPLPLILPRSSPDSASTLSGGSSSRCSPLQLWRYLRTPRPLSPRDGPGSPGVVSLSSTMVSGREALIHEA